MCTTMIRANYTIFIVTFVLFVIGLASLDKRHCDRNCKCKRNSVDLSNQTLHRFYDQQFPNGTVCIDFSHNNFSSLNATDWRNLPHTLKYLYLKKCGIRNIPSKKLFANITSLILLDISYNDLTEKGFFNLWASIQDVAIQTIDISGLDVGKVLHKFNITIPTNVRTLRLNRCKLKTLDQILKPHGDHSFLKVLELRGNHIHETSLSVFKMYGNHYARLTGLKLSFNPIKELVPDAFTNLCSLERLWLDNLDTRSTVFTGVNSSSLQLLVLSNSFIFQSVENCKDAFKLSPFLTISNMTGIQFLGNWSDQDLLHLFSPLEFLDTLILSNTSLETVPRNLFNQFNSLRVLDLSKNGIVDWETDCFENMSKHFSKLYLNNNKISSITNNSFPMDVLENLEKLHLYGNVFHCDCSTHWFRYWMKSNYDKLDARSEYLYECHSPAVYNRTKLVDFDPDYEDCFGLTVAEFMALSIVGLCFVTVWGLNTFKLVQENLTQCLSERKE